MKKKVALFILVSFVIIFIIIYYNKNNVNEESYSNNSIVEIFDNPYMNNDDWYSDNITSEERKVLEKHLYGQWKFSERIYLLDQTNNTYYDYERNFSEEGVEVLKDVVIKYDEQLVTIVGGVGQKSFTNSRDLYLFMKYGGDNSVRYPVYHVQKMDSNTIEVDYLDYLGDEFTFEGSEMFIMVSYNLGYNTNYNPSVLSRYLGSTVYIDPSDKDTIYLNFCGIWKLERDNNNYDPSTKSEY